MTHLLLKQLHVTLALLSISGFIVRWIWRMVDSQLHRLRWVKILPHLIDSLFLLTGILLALRIAQYPLNDAWLTAKVGGLLLYIVVGAVAMRTAPRLKYSLPAFALALLVFGWIVSVARLRTPLGWLVFF